MLETTKMTTLGVLYARDSKQRIKEWKIELAIDDTNHVFLHINHGLLLGTKETDIVPIAEGKNIGKSNATTPQSQAILEAKTRIRRKEQEGYKTGVTLRLDAYLADTLQGKLELALPKSNTGIDGILLPMKCSPYYRKGTKKATIKFPCYGQPKVNGFRATAKLEVMSEGAIPFDMVVLRGKKGIEIPLLTQIIDEFKTDWFQARIGDDDIELAFDGELYVHGLKLQEISSAVRARGINTHRVEFRIFDVAVPNLTQEVRIGLLELLEMRLAASNCRFIKVVPTATILDDNMAQTFCDASISDGFEGAVFRDMKADYAFGKRPRTIVKLKRSEDSEFEILDVVLPEDQTDSSYAVLKCRNDINSETFDCSIEGGHEFRASLYAGREEIIGKYATVKYFERTEAGKPFHAICTLISLKKEIEENETNQ